MELGKVEIRPAELGDLHAVVQIGLADYIEQQFWATGYDFSYRSAMQSAEMMIVGKIPGEIIVAVDRDNRIVGALIAEYSFYLCDHYRPACFVAVWYVEPAYRGNGIGKELLQALENSARKRGASTVARGVMLQNPNREWLMEKTVAEGYLPAQTMAFKPLGG